MFRMSWRYLIMKKWVLGALLLMILLFAGASVSAQGASVVQAQLQPVNDSGISGFVLLRQPPNAEGPKINVIAFGLQSGQNYVSLYYDNHTCDLEPYSAEDVIGGIYTANPVGVGVTHGEADDD